MWYLALSFIGFLILSAMFAHLSIECRQHIDRDKNEKKIHIYDCMVLTCLCVSASSLALFAFFLWYLGGVKI